MKMFTMVALTALVAMCCLQNVFSFSPGSFRSRAGTYHTSLSMKKDSSNFDIQHSLSRCGRFLGATIIACTTSSAASFGASLGAADLFQKSETEMKEAAQLYKVMNDDWAKTKKSLDQSMTVIGKSSGEIEKIASEIGKLDSDLRELTERGKADAVKLAKEVEDITAVVSEKYTTAERAAQDVNAKPVTIGNLFAVAQNDAFVLSETVNAAKQYTDINTQVGALVKKLDTVRDQLKQLEASADDVQSTLPASLVDMSQGIDKNLKFCRDKLDECNANGKEGLKQFKTGVEASLGAQDKFSRVIKSLDGDIRSLQSIKNEFTRLLSTINSQNAARDEWMKTTKLTLKGGKSLPSSYSASMASVAKSFEDKYAGFIKTYNSIAIDGNGSDRGNNNKNQKKETTSTLLRSTLTDLEAAQRTGINAEKLLEKAREVGNKEAAKYIKALPKLPTESSTAGTSTGSAKPAKSSAYASRFKGDTEVMMSSP